MFRRKKYLQELESFEIGDMPIEIPKGGLVLRIVFICSALVVAFLLFYNVISTITALAHTISPSALGMIVGAG